MGNLRRRGQQAEALAAHYLEQRGYRLVARNVHIGRLGEIDLIAYDGEVLVFVEVKARSSVRWGLPEEALTPRKRRFLMRAARAYLVLNGIEHTPCRFDVVAIDLWTHPPQIRLYQNAFGSEEAL